MNFVATLAPYSIMFAPNSALKPVGPAADKISHLAWLMIILFLITIVVMAFLIVLPAIFRRGSLEEHDPIDVGGGQTWITVGGFIVPAIVLTFLFVLGLTAMSRFPMHEGRMSSGMHVQIRLTGHQWWWEATYPGDNVTQQFKTANELHIPVGQPVDIELDSKDVIHSFWVPQLHGKVDLVPGMKNYIRIQADQPGTYGGTCAEYCGAQHAKMRLLVVAQSPEDYQAWLEGQRKESALPEGPQATHGQQLFLSGPCANCHRIAGTLAGGTVAPDLTHLASRQRIAANTYPNDKAHLSAWITQAQSLKPQCQMPNLTQFNGIELGDLVAYLQQLK